MNGGDDGARTRDLCRDSTEAGSNLLKLRVTDGFFWRSEIPVVTVIGPLLDLRPLPCRPLPQSDFGMRRRQTSPILCGFDCNDFALAVPVHVAHWGLPQELAVLTIELVHSKESSLAIDQIA